MLGYNVGARLFSEYNKEIIYYGIMNSKDYIKLINLSKDFMICDCYDKPYCNCFEKNISRHIVDRRLQGWSPVEISREFMKIYDVMIYPGDIYSYLDQVLMKLEAVKRIANSFKVIDTVKECNKLIKKIEEGN